MQRPLVMLIDEAIAMAEAEGEDISGGVNHGPFIWIHDGKGSPDRALIELVDHENGSLEIKMRTVTDGPE
jgi:hypothetical protein